MEARLTELFFKQVKAAALRRSVFKLPLGAQQLCRRRNRGQATGLKSAGVREGKLYKYLMEATFGEYWRRQLQDRDLDAEIAADTVKENAAEEAADTRARALKARA